jgi:hypothetical protein
VEGDFFEGNNIGKALADELFGIPHDFCLTDSYYGLKVILQIVGNHECLEISSFN